MKYIAPRTTEIVAVEFVRPADGLCWNDAAPVRDVPLSRLPGWQSCGGPHNRHPSRTLPSTLKADLPDQPGQLVRLYVVGVFALWATSDLEEPGTVGGGIELWDDQQSLHVVPLVNNCHYTDASLPDRAAVLLGDGSGVETIGHLSSEHGDLRVDLLTLEIPPGIAPRSVWLRDAGSPASFIVFDIAAEYQTEQGCPFKAKSGGVSLGELGAIVRLGDRLRLNKALDQLNEALSVPHRDLDDARGMALTFLGVICSATLELGGSRKMHRVQLDAARQFEALATGKEIAQATRSWVEYCLSDLVQQPHGLSGQLIDRALAIVDRHYASDLTDSALASKLGLSTSHFRALFKQATGQPFHRYLTATRLEKAKQMLMEMDLPVTDVASTVGFVGLSHFSRAFAQRFGVSPTNLRRLGR